MQIQFLAEAAPKSQILGNQEIILQAESRYDFVTLQSSPEHLFLVRVRGSLLGSVDIWSDVVPVCTVCDGNLDGFSWDRCCCVWNSFKQVNIRCNFNFHTWGKKPEVNCVLSAVFL